jgi:thymidylate synthase (FAD)
MFVKPAVFLTGYTAAYSAGIQNYLKHSNQLEFMDDIHEATRSGISDAEILCSLYAKLCYKSLVEGKNANVKKTRSIAKNIEATHNAAHGSVFEHVGFNFIVTDCSRVFTHELVRHRVGTAFSQTSGRYCRPVDNGGTPQIDFVHDPILDPVKTTIEASLSMLAAAYRVMEIRLGLLEQSVADRMIQKLMNTIRDYDYNAGAIAQQDYHDAKNTLALLGGYKESTRPFDDKKKLTSALRRILPNGQSNEIAFSCNIRTLRHTIQLRTQRFAEWEIRNVFAQIYNAVKEKFPTIFYGAKERIVDGLPEIYGMRLQPYDISVPHLPALSLVEELRKRKFKFASDTEERMFINAINSPFEELQPTV